MKRQKRLKRLRVIADLADTINEKFREAYLQSIESAGSKRWPFVKVEIQRDINRVTVFDGNRKKQFEWSNSKLISKLCEMDEFEDKGFYMAEEYLRGILEVLNG